MATNCFVEGQTQQELQRRDELIARMSETISDHNTTMDEFSEQFAETNQKLTNLTKTMSEMIKVGKFEALLVHRLISITLSLSSD